MEAQHAGVGWIPRALGPREGGGGCRMVPELLLGETQVEQEHPVAPAALGLLGTRSGQERLDQRDRPGVVAPRLGDRQLQVRGLEIVRGGGEHRVRDRLRFVEAAQVAQAPALEVEREGVRGVLAEHGVRLVQGLLGALRLLQHLAQRQAHPEVAGLHLERLTVVQDGLVGLLGVAVDLAEDLVGARRFRLQLERGLERRRGLLRQPRQQQLGATLDVRLEVAGIERQVDAQLRAEAAWSRSSP